MNTICGELLYRQWEPAASYEMLPRYQDSVRSSDPRCVPFVRSLKTLLRLLLILAIAPITSWASDPITIDGLFDDWIEVPVATTDPSNDNILEDFAELRITNDDDFLFVYLRFHDGEHLIQDFNKIRLYIDTDNNTATGLSISGIGAELEWCFGCRSGKYYSGAGPDSIYQNDIVLRSAPTVTSQEFEIAISQACRVMTLDGTQTADTISVVVVESDPNGDTLPDNGSVPYVFDSTSVVPPDPIPLARHDTSHIRIVTYNTLRSGLLDEDQRPHFERIIKVLRPDIIAFQEQDDVSVVEQLITTWLPNETWHASDLYHGELLVVSKYPVLQEAALISSDRMHAVLLNTQEDLGSNLLVINTHLACCRQDDLRQQDADEFVKVMREWRAGTGPFVLNHAMPFVNVGDFNLVGYSQQVRTLRDGNILNETTYGSDFPPDWDGTSVVDLFSRHTHTRMGYTWRDDLSSFSPGKLDYVFYSNSVINVGNHFVLNTLDMPEQDLALYGLQRQDTQMASDHLPRIVDIASVHPVDVKEENGASVLPDDFRLCSVYPNPFHSMTRIEYTLQKPSRVALRIHNLLGQGIRTLIDEIQPAGRRVVTWDGKDARGDVVGAGLYLCTIENEKTSRTVKVILLE